MRQEPRAAPRRYRWRSDGPLDLLRRDGRLGPDRAPRPARPADPPQWGEAALRLRRRDPAPAPEVGRPGRPRRRLHHPFPRRPLARPAGHAQVAGAARPGGAPDRQRPSRPRVADGGHAGRRRHARLRASPRRARALRRSSTATATGSRLSPSTTASASPTATCCSRTTAPANSTRRRRGIWGSRTCATTGACSAERRSAASVPSRCSASPGAVARSSSPATRRPPETLAVAAHGADVLIHEATFAEEDAARARRRATAQPARPA